MIDASNKHKIKIKNKDMKQYFIALALMLTLSASTMNAVPKHRHHPQTTAVVAAPDSASEGVDAYSDTTSVDNSDAAAVDSDDTAAADNYDSNYSTNNPFDYWNHSIGWGFGGVMLAILIIVLCFVFLLAPFIIVALVIRYLIKRHNDRVTLAEKAMETGQPVPESVKPVDKQSDDYLWKRGIRNMAIGCGLMLMFWFWDANALAGVGALVLCYGAGQAIMARTSANKKDRNSNDDDLK